jgi:hypothetical protein
MRAPVPDNTFPMASVASSLAEIMATVDELVEAEGPAFSELLESVLAEGRAREVICCLVVDLQAQRSR